MHQISFSKLLVLSFLFTLPQFHASAQQLRAPAWPLAVKNPFVNSWVRAGSNPLPMNQDYPKIWNSLDSSETNSDLGWWCGVLVDGIPYRLLGSGPTGNASTQLSVQITSTQTVVTHQAGPMEITMQFLSPLTPTDLTRQSLPFVYLAITASSSDGSAHSLQVYFDTSAEWVIGDNSLHVNPIGTNTSDFVILQASLNTPQPFVVINDRATDATSIHAIKNGDRVSYGVGSDVRDRGMNVTGPALSNTVEPNIETHSIDDPWDFWGILVDLGEVANMTSPVVSAVGVIRDPSIQFTQSSGNVETRSSYYQMNFSTPLDMASFFLNDFDTALNASKQFDSQITNDAANISQPYADLLSLITRQAMSAIEITISKSPDGSFNSTDIMAFLMDMGSVGEGYVNAVDVLYAAFPMYLYLNPALGGYLLRPLLIAQDTPQYTQAYAAQGLGTLFPNATIEDVSHNYGIEETGNMIIMLLAHLQATGDGSLIKQHYTLIKHWADYLVQSSLNPGSQRTSPSDAISSMNQTNLALKGIIGIGAAAKISSFMGMDDDASVYSSNAKSYINQWQNISISKDKSHLLTSFASDLDSSDSAGLIYNLYADKLLQLDLVPQSIYELQNSYYNSQLPSNKFGIPLDSQNPTLTRADWLMFAAAASGNSQLQNSLVSMIHSYVFQSSSNLPVSPLYDPASGNSGVNGINSPSMGALFSILALNKPLHLKINGTSLNASAPTEGREPPGSSSKTGAIVKGIICGVAGLGVLCLGIFFYRYRKRCVQKRVIETHPFTVVDTATLEYSQPMEKGLRIRRPKAEHIASEPPSPAIETAVVDQQGSLPPPSDRQSDPPSGLQGEIIGIHVRREIARYLEAQQPEALLEPPSYDLIRPTP